MDSGSCHLGRDIRIVRNGFIEGTGNGGSIVPSNRRGPVFISRHGSVKTLGNSQIRFAFLTHQGGRVGRTRIGGVLRHTGSAFINELGISGSLTCLIAPDSIFTRGVVVPEEGIGNKGASSGTIMQVVR